MDFGIKSELEYDVFMYRYLYYHVNPKCSSYKLIYMCALAKHENTNILFVLYVSLSVCL